MIKFLLKRLVLLIPILLGVAFLVFVIMEMTPGSPALMILGPTASQDAIAQLNRDFGFDRPFFVRFFDYLINIITKFDFGNSYNTRAPVVTEILARFPTTFKFAVLSMIFSSIVGISLGILSAVRQYSAIDTTFTVIAMFFASIPGFWLGLMLILIFSLRLGIFPSHGIDSWRSYILPTLTLVCSGSAGLLRITRTAMLETIRQDYIRTARAKGVHEHIVIWKHALKNAMLPVITVLGSSFGMSLGGAVILETVFSIPGIGQYIVVGIRSKDIPVVMSGTLFLAVMFCLIVLIIDVLYAFIDPRIKARFAK